MYLAGTTITVQVPLLNYSGATVTPTVAPTYSLLDESGVVLLSNQTATWTSPDTTASITISSVNNTLSPGAYQAARQIVLSVTTAEGIDAVSFTYVIQSTYDGIVVGVNAAGTVAKADMLALSMGLDQWFTLSMKSKAQHLRAAYQRLALLRYQPLDSFYYDQTNPFRPKLTNGVSLLDLSISEFNALDVEFLTALNKAQLVEAHYVAFEEAEVADDRLVLDTIGDVKQMYRNSKSIKSVIPVTEKAFLYLTKYATLSTKVLGRA